MIWMDYAILIIIGISALISVLRGFVREALSLLGWIIAIWVSLSFADNVAVLLGDKIFCSVGAHRVRVSHFILCLPDRGWGGEFRRREAYREDRSFGYR